MKTSKCVFLDTWFSTPEAKLGVAGPVLMKNQVTGLSESTPKCCSKQAIQLFRGDQVFLLATVMYDFAIYDSVHYDYF